MVGLSVSMVGFSTIEPKINTKGTSVEIAMIENVGQDKNSKQINKQFKIVIFHPFESRLSSITKSCKNVSRLFISGHLSQEPEFQQSKPQQKSQQQFQQELELQQSTELPSQPTNQSVKQQVQSSNAKKKNQTF
ncbi:145_t:CDS:2 [Entrophospora sp. SA101]|nr:145_t:CDS:2 [Entrophospora sp. SA101]